MLEIKKEKTELDTYDIFLTDQDNTFKVIFGGNGDLYWGLYPKGSTKLVNKCKKTQFYITKENYEIYELFNQLYNDVKECNISEVDEWDLVDCETDEEVDEKYKEKQKSNLELKNSYIYNLLFNNNVISWHNDDYDYDEGNIVNIIKENEQFIIDFQFKKQNGIYGSSWVRFRNSGSRYSPFNILFMRMYNKLQNYDTEYHQMNIEEYIYQKSLKK